MAPATMEVADISVVVIYFILVLAIGLIAMRRANKNTVSGYFLAGRSMNWAAVGASLFVSNIGSEHFIGLAGSGAASGFGVAAWEINALLLLQLLGWVFIPVYIQSGVYTMPEYLTKRFGGKRLKVYFAALSLVLYIFTKVSVDLYAGALFIQESLGWNLYLSIILLIAMTALLTVTGGFRTKYMQASPNITAILLSSPNLTYSASCHLHLHPKPDALKILRGPRDPDLPWPGFLLGQTPASIWYWCADQVIVQRVLATKNIAHAKGATIMAGFLKILPMFIIVIPGMISRIFFADQLACISPEHCLEVCGSASGCSNVAYPRLVMLVMPVGLRGLMMAVMIAALMSDLDSIFNSASTIFALDIYKMMRKQVSSRELVIVGRLFVVFMVVISIAWVPVVIEMQGGQIFYYIQEVTDYLTPPIAALFLLAVLWHRCNETGAFWGSVGFLDRCPRCDQPDDRPSFIKDIHFMYVAAILFWVSALVTVVVSLCTPPPDQEQIRTTTLWGLRRRKRLREKAGEDMTALKPLNHSNGLTGREKSPDQQDNGIEANHEETQPSNGHAVIVGDLASDPSMEEEGERKGVGEEDGCLGGGVVEGGKCLKALEFFCGFQEKPSQARVLSAEEQEQILDQLLHEPRRTKILLNTALLAICSVGIFIFIYFSL
ncbi:hypothetical protein F7725_009018 [Dissostichus mawsoni]|uniref:Sodium/myo-inositol cotransporter n=1 Tax=Dissostichus mawsoni TaxID=36200 RepID=A0A7J5Z7U1_DISMA|nr:hypothetical protein F7725_009018 [Dissostichus mawsoni]